MAIFPGIPESLDSSPAFQFLRPLWDNPVAQTAAISAIAGILIYNLNHVLDEWAWNNYSTARRWDWRKEIVLVTGGSSGIGESVVRKLAKRSIKVIVFDLNHPKEPFPSNVFFYKVDVASPESVSQAAESLREEVGHPTVLINNAGIGYAGDVLATPIDQVRKVFDVNTISHFILAKEFVPNMVANDHGHVLTVASLGSFVTIAGNTDYSCTKASAMAFHEGLRQDLIHIYGVKHIRTSIIHPFFVKTAMTEPIWDRFGSDLLPVDDVGERIVEQIVRGKSGRIMIPTSLSAARLVRALPDWAQEWVRGSRSRILTKHKTS